MNTQEKAFLARRVRLTILKPSMPVDAWDRKWRELLRDEAQFLREQQKGGHNGTSNDQKD